MKYLNTNTDYLTFGYEVATKTDGSTDAVDYAYRLTSVDVMQDFTDEPINLDLLDEYKVEFMPEDDFIHHVKLRTLELVNDYTLHRYTLDEINELVESSTLLEG